MLVGCCGQETVWRRLSNATVVSAASIRTGRDGATTGVASADGGVFGNSCSGLGRSKRLNDV